MNTSLDDRLKDYEPSTYEVRRKLEELIARTFDGCLDICTGNRIYM